jgi:DNA-directed RNA polymerase I, II, and III subunit RPABC4
MNPSGSVQENAGNGGPGNWGAEAVPMPPKRIVYECGDCSAEVELKPRDPVRCQECGYRILYKPRTRAIVQYIAR